MNKQEFIVLRNLLHRYMTEKKLQYPWFSTDEIIWLIEEIERDDLELPDGERTYDKKEE